VVDPALKGKVKITVIATGFGGPAAAKPAGASLYTPVDMSIYSDHVRVRPEPAAPLSVSAPRLSIARRPAIDLPAVAAAVGGGSAVGSMMPMAMSASSTHTHGSAGMNTAVPPGLAASSSVPGSSPADDIIVGAAGEDGSDPDGMLKLRMDADFDMSSTFDVPAFLRRQES
jgi:hypothetical protein